MPPFRGITPRQSRSRSYTRQRHAQRKTGRVPCPTKCASSRSLTSLPRSNHDVPRAGPDVSRFEQTAALPFGTISTGLINKGHMIEKIAYRGDALSGKNSPVPLSSMEKTSHGRPAATHGQE